MNITFFSWKNYGINEALLLQKKWTKKPCNYHLFKVMNDNVFPMFLLKKQFEKIVPSFKRAKKRLTPFPFLPFPPFSRVDGHFNQCHCNVSQFTSFEYKCNQDFITAPEFGEMWESCRLYSVTRFFLTKYLWTNLMGLV